MPSNVLVTNAGYGAANGTYTYRGTVNGRGVWTLAGQPDDFVDFFYSIYWLSAQSKWQMYGDAEPVYESTTDTANPWDATWNDNPGFGLPVPTVAEIADVWYNASWGYRVKITVDNTKVDADLTNFPVYVNLNNLPAGFHAHVNQTDGRDIRVTTADGTTEVPREVEFYTSGSDTGEIWFKAPSLSNTVDTDFYIYYGNGSATEPAEDAAYGRENVWESNFKLVAHGGDGSTLAVDDSTSSDFDGTNNGATVTSGKIGGGISFDNSNDYVDFGSSATLKGLAASSFTFSVWLNPTLDSAVNPIIGNTTSLGWHARLLNTNKVRFILITSGGDFKYADTASALSAGWSHVVGTWDGTNIRIYVNGSLSDSNTGAGGTLGALTSTTNTYIGTFPGSSDFYGGTMDEVRLATAARTATYISTEYKNQNSPSTFYSVGSEEANAQNLQETKTGSITPSGVARKAVTMTRSGSIATGGVMIRSVSARKTGSLTPSGSVAKLQTLYRGLSSTITMSGAIARAYLGQTAGALTPSGTIATVRNYARSLSANLTPSGAAVKAVTTARAGEIETTGEIATARYLPLSGSIASAGQIIKSVSRSITSAVPLAGTAAKIASRAFTGAVTMASTVADELITILGLSGSIGSSGTVRKAATRTLAGGIAPSGAKQGFITRLLTGEITPAGAMTAVKMTLVALASSIGLSGTIAKRSERAFTGEVSPTSAQTKATITSKAGAMVVSGIISPVKNLAATLAGALTPSGSLRKDAARATTGSIATSGTAVKDASKGLSGSIGLSGAIQAARQYFRTLTGSIPLAGTVAGAFARTFTGVINLIGNVFRGSADKVDWTVSVATVTKFTVTAAPVTVFSASVAPATKWSARVHTI